MRRLEALQGFKQIYAPFDGIITRRDIDIGSLITFGSTGNLFPRLLEMPKNFSKLLKSMCCARLSDVPQPFFRLIYEGLEAQAIVREYPEKVFKGIVDRTTGSLDTHRTHTSHTSEYLQSP